MSQQKPPLAPNAILIVEIVIIYELEDLISFDLSI